MELYTLDDLTALKSDERTFLGVLGDPVKHSLSPYMHTAALAELAKKDPAFLDWAYVAVHLSAESLKQGLGELWEAGFVGLNLTIPHKVLALELVTEITDEAKSMGAVNTLSRDEFGYRGANTDGFGILHALEESFSISLVDRDIWLMGAGGAARGIAIACLRGDCGRLTVVNRSQERLSGLLEQVGSSAREGQLRGFLNETNPNDYRDKPVIINATSLGLKKEDGLPFSLEKLPSKSLIYDTTYGIENQLCREARSAGHEYADGLSMLVWQGVRSLEIWTGKQVAASWMERAAREELKKRAHGNH